MLYADMALYDMLHLFETGRSHMALLARSRTGHGLTAAEAAQAFTEAPLPINGKQDQHHSAHKNGHAEHLNGMSEVLHPEVHLGITFPSPSPDTAWLFPMPASDHKVTTASTCCP